MIVNGSTIDDRSGYALLHCEKCCKDGWMKEGMNLVGRLDGWTDRWTVHLNRLLLQSFIIAITIVNHLNIVI